MLAVTEVAYEEETIVQECVKDFSFSTEQTILGNHKYALHLVRIVDLIDHIF